MRKPLTQSECREWIAALRSGKFQQTKRKLRAHVDEYDYNSPMGYCCLGVEKKIHPTQCKAVTFDQELLCSSTDGHPYRLPSPIQDTLAIMNDTGKSFKYIAAYIERYILPKL